MVRGDPAGQAGAMSTEIPPPGRPLASRPGGVITRRQALATGLPATTVESWVQRGRWSRLARGIYATAGGPPSRAAGAGCTGGPGSAPPRAFWALGVPGAAGAAPPPAEGARAVGCRPVRVMKAGHARNLLTPARGEQRQPHHGAPDEFAEPRRPS